MLDLDLTTFFRLRMPVSPSRIMSPSVGDAKKSRVSLDNKMTFPLDMRLNQPRLASAVSTYFAKS